MTINNNALPSPFDRFVDTACYMPLHQLTVVSVSGEDSTSFLQNLLTNDIQLLAVNNAQYSGLCNPKGRLLALFLIIRIDEQAYQLVMPADLSDAIVKRLKMYVLRSKVTIDDADSIRCLGLTQARDDLALATENYAGQTDADYRTVKLPSTVDRWLMLCSDGESAIALLAQKGYQQQDAAYWYWLDIMAGLANVYAATQEQFTPQQLNLDITEAVNFKKGCYPGQEVVARLHYLGKPSRRLFIAQADSTQAVAAGDEVLTADDKVAGHFVSIVQQDQQMWCLVSLKLSELEAKLVMADGQPLTLLSKLADD